MYCVVCCWFLFFFKQKTAYEMRISDWSSDVCSSDLPGGSRDDLRGGGARVACPAGGWLGASPCSRCAQKSGTGCVSKDWRPTDQGDQIGRASCRDRVCQYV